MDAGPRVTLAVPSYNQGRFLAEALESIFSAGVPVEVYVADGGSSDDSVEVIKRYESRLLGWRSRKDAGQAAAINEGVAAGTAPFVAWLNSDDLLLPGGLAKLLAALERSPEAPFAYGRVWDRFEDGRPRKPVVMVRPWSEWWMAQACIVSQPGTLVRRAAWEAMGGVDAALHLAMDYDLWWRLAKRFGPPAFIEDFVAENRVHGATKTSTLRVRHYREAIAVVRRHYGRVPLKWYLAQPYAVWYRKWRGK